MEGRILGVWDGKMLGLVLGDLLVLGLLLPDGLEEGL